MGTVVGRALPVAVAVICLVELALSHAGAWPLVAVAEVLACAVLLGRSRWPLLAGPAAALIPLVASTTVSSDQANEPSGGLLIAVVASYSLGRWGRPVPGIVAFGATYAAIAVLAGFGTVDDVLWGVVIVLPPFLMGALVQRLHAHTLLLRRERALVQQESVRIEGDRIARELHDVIAHSVSAMVVQTAAARDLVHRDPDRALVVLRRVADSGRRAIEESDRLVHVIRDGQPESGPELQPNHGLGDVPALVAEFRQQGLGVDFVTDDPPTRVDTVADVAAYRIAREALTNALRYSADRTARLEVRVGAADVTVRTANPANGRTGDGSGLGLVGLRERVDLLRGELRHKLADGSFELVARVPREPE